MTKPEIDAEGLLPCPFCGSTDLGDQGPSYTQIMCNQCGASEYDQPTRAEAIAAWNRRATTRTSEAEPVANTIDREALRKRIENDPDEGEIGAGFEMFTPEAEVALERMAFAALPRWAQDELTALRAAATLPTPASDDQVEACPVCAVAFKPDDMCLTDIEMGTCHAACLEGAPMVDLETGDPLPEGAPPPAPYRFAPISDDRLEAVALAKAFHETYERLAPSFGYETRQETRVFDPTSPNGLLMVAVCSALAAMGSTKR